MATTYWSESCLVEKAEGQSVVISGGQGWSHMSTCHVHLSWDWRGGFLQGWQYSNQTVGNIFFL